ncbi:MAG: hypothetical protein PHV60_03820 [bacterium]|nr:hypothetical protein [bacterium]
MTDRKEIRGLLRLSGWVFYGWGVLVTIYGFLKLLNIVKPDSEFITAAEWMRFNVFQVTYGMVCVGVGYLLFLFIKKKLK